MKKQVFNGKFEIQGEIAKGQTGAIYYGYDLELRQEVAIKIYHSHINGRLIRGKAFIEKSKPLLSIDHQNLIKIFKVEEDDDTPVVFMEFFDAPSLQEIIHDQDPLSVSDMLTLAREITEVLVHTHFQGIIHGTLHPGHVLVGSQGQVKVMDLGLSWILMDILTTCEPELLRPLPYFPPEIAKGELLNVSSDLYCLGFMMYEMLTGTVPYSGLPKTSIMGKLAFDQTDPAFEFPSAVPETVCDLIRDMTRNKAKQRLQDAAHVLTIINQQLAKFPSNSDSRFQSVSPAPPKTATQEKSPAPAPLVETDETPTETLPSATPVPTLKKTPAVQRPHTSINYQRANRMKQLRKLGFFLGILLLIAGGVMGYWYRGLIETSIQGVSPVLGDSLPETSIPQTMPTDKGLPTPEPEKVLEIQDSLNHSEDTQLTDSPAFSEAPEGTTDKLMTTPFSDGSEHDSEDSLESSEHKPEISQSSDSVSKQTSEVSSSGSEIPPSKTSPSKAADENAVPTDKEIEELLQSLDSPEPDIPSIKDSASQEKQ